MKISNFHARRTQTGKTILYCSLRLHVFRHEWSSFGQHAFVQAVSEQFCFRSYEVMNFIPQNTQAWRTSLASHKHVLVFLNKMAWFIGLSTNKCNAPSAVIMIIHVNVMVKVNAFKLMRPFVVIDSFVVPTVSLKWIVVEKNKENFFECIRKSRITALKELSENANYCSIKKTITVRRNEKLHRRSSARFTYKIICSIIIPKDEISKFISAHNESILKSPKLIEK